MKKKDIVENRKTEAMAIKQRRTRGEISFFSKKKGNYKVTPNLDQVDNEYLL